MTSAPVSLVSVALVIALGSLLSIGGGNGQIAVIQDFWVDPGLLDPADFAWALALGHLSPGPKAGFLAGIGYSMYGAPGAVAASLGVILPTWIGAAAASHWFARMKNIIDRVGLPATFVVAGMIAAAAWKLAEPMDLTPVEIGAAATVAILVGWRNVEPAFIVLGSAVAGVLLRLAGA